MTQAAQATSMEVAAALMAFAACPPTTTSAPTRRPRGLSLDSLETLSDVAAKETPRTAQSSECSGYEVADTHDEVLATSRFLHHFKSAIVPPTATRCDDAGASGADGHAAGDDGNADTARAGVFVVSVATAVKPSSRPGLRPPRARKPSTAYASASDTDSSDGDGGAASDVDTDAVGVAFRRRAAAGVRAVTTRRPPAPATAAVATARVGKYSAADRKRIIKKFLEKRKRRVWVKKVRYNCRKTLADKRLRVKGRFVKKEEVQLLTA